MGKTIAQWVAELINEDNVKLVIQLIPDVTNPSSNAKGDWVVYSGISVVDGGGF